jgi:hypothetical protein
MIGRRPPKADKTEVVGGFDSFELRLGDVMRGERATLGKSLIDVQRELKIKATYIAAIENCDASAFDTPGFIAGYVRSYARFLGLDPEWAWTRFCNEAGFEVPHGLSSAASSPRAPRPAPRRTGLDALGDPNAPFVPRGESLLSQVQPRAVGSLLVLVTLIGALGYGAFSVLQEVQRVTIAPVERAPGIVAEIGNLPATSPTAGETPGLTGAAAFGSPPAAETLARLYRPPALDVPVMVARDGPIAAVDPMSEGALAALSPPAPSADPGVDTVVAQADGALPLPQVVADEAPEVALLAVRPTWVRVSGADGTVLLEKILEPGERWTVPATEDPPVVRTGNSGALYFAVNGQTHGPAAPGAQVVRNIALSAENLSTAFAVADLTADPDLAAYMVAEAAAQGIAAAPSE